MKNSTGRKLLALLILGYWVFLIGFAVVDNRGLLGSDIGLIQSLQTSSLARVMFMDIGGLSTVVALWILFTTKYRIRYLVAGITLIVGSFVALPYIAYTIWKNS
jgi:hypothetical protein